MNFVISKIDFMKYFFSFLVSFIAFLPIGFSQLEKTLYQDFNVDQVKSILFEMPREYKIEKWAGTQILIETKVQLMYASEAVLKYIIENERYALLMEPEGDDGIVIRSKEMKPGILKSKAGEVTETVDVKIYIPEEFTIDENNRLYRDLDTNSSTIRKW